jgi:hypothetical protein
MTMRGSGRSFLRTMTRRMRHWTQTVAEGKDPWEAVKQFYPECDNIAMRVEELFAHPKVKYALKMLTEQNLRQHLMKILNDPKAKTRDVLMAARQIERLDNPPVKPEEKKKKPFLVRPGIEDDTVAEKMRELEKKAQAS